MSELRKPIVSNTKYFRARESYFPVSELDADRWNVLCIQMGDLLEFVKNADNGTGCVIRNERTNKRGFVSKVLNEWPL